MEQKLSKVGVYPFVAEQYMCNFRKQIFASALVQQMLATADYHSRDRGFGTVQLFPQGKTWVLSRFAIEINDLPPRHAKYNIETYIENLVSFFSNRNFVAKYPNGDVIAYGRSTWAMLDIETRQPRDIMELSGGAMEKLIAEEFKSAEENNEQAQGVASKVPIAKPNRVNVDSNAPLFRVIETYYNDVDFNGHVNSIRYIEHVLDLFSMDWHKKYIVKRLDVIYSAEAHCGDKLKFYCSAPTFPEQAGEGDRIAEEYAKKSPAELDAPLVEYKVRICKQEPGSETETECVRLKVLWRRF